MLGSLCLGCCRACSLTCSGCWRRAWRRSRRRLRRLRPPRWPRGRRRGGCSASHGLGCAGMGGGPGGGWDSPFLRPLPLSLTGGDDTPREWCCPIWFCRLRSSLLKAATWSATRWSCLCKETPRPPCTTVHLSELFCLWGWLLPCALPGREDLLGFMAAGCDDPPGRCPLEGSRVGRQGAWGRGKSRFASSPAGGVGGARAPRCPPPARTLLLLAPGAWIPGWFCCPLGGGLRLGLRRPSVDCGGPGLEASPNRSPSCQLWDWRSWVLELSAPLAVCHNAMSTRRSGPHEAQT